MTAHWQVIPSLKPQILILEKYQWDEGGFVLWLKDTVDNQEIQIRFPVDLDGFRVLYRHNSVQTESMVYQLMKAAGISLGEHFVPAFIQDSSDLIDYVRDINKYGNLENVQLLHYTIITDDFWIDVVSDTPPQIAVAKDRGTVRNH